MRSPRVGALGAAVTVGAVLWVLGTALAPALPLYAAVCHRLPGRSLSLDAVPLGVCARCTGLYLGGAAGLVIAALTRPRRPALPRPQRMLLFLAALAPTALDGTASVLWGEGLANLPRMLVALPAGVVAGWFLLEALDDLERTIRDHARDLEAS